MSIDKTEWIQSDRLRWAREFGIPMSEKWPDKYPGTVTLQVGQSAKTTRTQLNRFSTGAACHLCLLLGVP